MNGSMYMRTARSLLVGILIALPFWDPGISRPAGREGGRHRNVVERRQSTPSPADTEGIERLEPCCAMRQGRRQGDASCWNGRTWLRGKRALITGATSGIGLEMLVNPSEVARAIVVLASDEAPFTVGSEFVIDGGMSTP